VSKKRQTEASARARAIEIPTKSELTPPATEVVGRFEVRPIGTSLGLRELAALHKRTWGSLGVAEKKVYSMLWRVGLHFGLYLIRAGEEGRRPPLVGAFWARSLDEAPLIFGHLYPVSLFRGLRANEVFEFGGMVIDPTLQHRGLVKALADAARIFLFARRPALIITTPIEPLHETYKRLGLRTVGEEPVDHPYVQGVKVYLMYAKLKELIRPYFM